MAYAVLFVVLNQYNNLESLPCDNVYTPCKSTLLPLMRSEIEAHAHRHVTQTHTDVTTWISSSSPHLALQAEGWRGDSLGWKSKTSKSGAFRRVLKVEGERCGLVSGLVLVPTSLRSCGVLAVEQTGDSAWEAWHLTSVVLYNWKDCRIEAFLKVTYPGTFPKQVP